MVIVADNEIDFLTLPNRKSYDIPDKKQNYVDNEKLLATLIKWRDARLLAAVAEATLPGIPDYVAKCIMATARSVASRYQFRNYTYIDEMISDGILNCTKYIKNFDHTKATRSGKPNPFGYITQIVKYAFWNYIKVEHKQEYVKLLSFEEVDGFAATEDESFHRDATSAEGAEIAKNHHDRLETFKEKFITRKQKEARQKKKELKKTPLNNLFVSQPTDNNEENNDVTTKQPNTDVKIW
ncbi:MAG: hypothetical protein KAS32_23540 [Candidatus Peribacteraceae bacterium]|nr:hypothetical protein [Candidatus Peribacteraceae bacterium]